MSLLAKRVAEEAKQSPTAISLPKSALLGYSSEILRKTSLAFCLLYFSVATKYSKKRSTSASLLRLKPFELKLTKKINKKVQIALFQSKGLIVLAFVASNDVCDMIK